MFSTGKALASITFSVRVTPTAGSQVLVPTATVNGGPAKIDARGQPPALSKVVGIL